jgi:hypothetical protein
MVSKTIPIRLADDIIDHADAIAAELSRRARGVTVSRSEVLRLAIEGGLERLQTELDAEEKKPRGRGKR